MRQGPLDVVLNAALLALVLYLLMRYVFVLKYCKYYKIVSKSK